MNQSEIFEKLVDLLGRSESDSELQVLSFIDSILQQD